MISKDVFCILYSGMPIEGFSSSNGYPIFTSGEKFTPDFTFNSYDSAKHALSYVMTAVIENGHDTADMSLLSIGAIRHECHSVGPYSAYDEVLISMMKETYTSPERIKYFVKQIIHLCVRHGFRKTLPFKHQEIINDPQFAELFNENVPFFVQENIERFMDVGINTCTPDEIAAIILTSSDELLKAIRIDSLNNVSK